MGFAVGWNIVYGNWLSIPTEITAICVLFEFWTDVNSSVWIIVFIVLTFGVGISYIRFYGEVCMSCVSNAAPFRNSFGSLTSGTIG